MFFGMADSGHDALSVTWNHGNFVGTSVEQKVQCTNLRGKATPCPLKLHTIRCAVQIRGN